MNKELPHNHGGKSIQVIEQMPSLDVVENVANVFKQLGDASRLRIFWFLCHCEECVTNIAAAMNMTSPAVSHHLRLLKSSNLIESHRHGKEMYYHATNTEIAQSLHHQIESLVKITCPDEK